MKRIKLLILLVLVIYCPQIFANYQDNKKNEEKLQEAVIYEEVKEIKHLLKKGVNVNTVDNRGFTPLMYAASRGNIEIINLLIKAGADVNIKNKNGDTALMRATEVEKDIDQLIDIFILNGANIEERDTQGWTVILIAASNRNVEMVRQLVKRGANIYTKNKFGLDLLTTAVIASDINMVNFILKFNYYIDINSGDRNLITPLMYAVISRNKQIIELLMKAGASLNFVDKSGKTAIDYAGENEDIKQLLFNLNSSFTK